MSELDDHINGIRGWLDKQGYPLEMTIARSLTLYGIEHFMQGYNYADPDTNETREIDILSNSFAYGTSTLLLQGIIECKYSALPLVAFTYRPSLEKSSLGPWIPSNTLGKKILNKLIADNMIGTLPIFSPQSPIAYSIKQALVGKGDQTKTKDNIFEAIITVAKASYYLSKLYDMDDIKLPTKDGTMTKLAAYIGIPTIIVRAPLYICYLDNNGEIAIEPRSSVLLEWTYPKTGIMMIKIIQEKEVGNFTKNITRSIETLNTQFPSYL